jgi:hypothetical protein
LSRLNAFVRAVFALALGYVAVRTASAVYQQFILVPGLKGYQFAFLPAVFGCGMAYGAWHFARTAALTGRGVTPPRGTLKLLVSAAVILSPIVYVMTRKTPMSILRNREDKSTVADLGGLRSHLGIYYGDTSGHFPANLAALTANGKYLTRLPKTRTGWHWSNDQVQELTGEELRAGGLSDQGGWAYVFTGPSSGTVLVNCTHTDTRGKVFSTY